MTLPGWPSCAKEGCPWPAFFKIRMENEAGPFWAHLCLFCMAGVRECLSGLKDLSESEQRLLEAAQEPRLEKARILGDDLPENPA